MSRRRMFTRDLIAGARIGGRTYCLTCAPDNARRLVFNREVLTGETEPTCETCHRSLVVAHIYSDADVRAALDRAGTVGRALELLDELAAARVRAEELTPDRQ